MPGYKRYLEKIEQERATEIAGMVRAPFSVGMSLDTVEFGARATPAMAPDTYELYTWETWTIWMQVDEVLG